MKVVDECLKIFFKCIDIRAHGHNPVGIERLFYIVHLFATHVGEAKVYTVSHVFNIFLFP